MVGLAELGGPDEIARHDIQHPWKRHETFDAGVPGLSADFLDETPREIHTVTQPEVAHQDLVRKGRGNQDLRQQGVGIERNWRDQTLQLLGGRWHSLTRVVRA